MFQSVIVFYFLCFFQSTGDFFDCLVNLIFKLFQFILRWNWLSTFGVLTNLYRMSGPLCHHVIFAVGASKGKKCTPRHCGKFPCNLPIEQDMLIGHFLWQNPCSFGSIVLRYHFDLIGQSRQINFLSVFGKDKLYWLHILFALCIVKL